MTQVWCCGVANGAKIVFERGKMVKADSLQSLNERMKTMDLDKNEIYKCLGVEQANGIKMKEYHSERRN